MWLNLPNQKMKKKKREKQSIKETSQMQKQTFQSIVYNKKEIYIFSNDLLKPCEPLLSFRSVEHLIERIINEMSYNVYSYE